MTEKDLKIIELKATSVKDKELIDELANERNELRIALLSFTRKLMFKINSAEEGTLHDARKILIEVLGERDLLVKEKDLDCEKCHLKDICEFICGIKGDKDE